MMHVGALDPDPTSPCGGLDFECRTLANVARLLQQIALRGHVDEDDLRGLMEWAPELVERLARTKAEGSRLRLRELAQTGAIPASWLAGSFR